MFAMVKTCHESGLSRKAFCKEHGISQAVFYYWQKQYQESLTQNHVGFIPLNTHRVAPLSETIEICYPNGVRIKLAQGTDLSVIRSFISLL
jgi:transposase-like protein